MTAWLLASLLLLAPAELPPLVAAARADLAQRAGVAPDSVTVVRCDAVTWPNSALGVPERGCSYTAVIVPGHRALFSAGEQVGLYHTGAGRFVRVSEPLKVDLQDLHDQALALAGRLVAVTGDLWAEQGACRLAERVTRSGAGWLPTRFSASVTGPVAEGWWTAAAALPTAVRLTGLMVLEGERPTLVPARIALHDPDPTREAHAETVAALLAAPEVYHGKQVMLPGELQVTPEGLLLRDERDRTQAVPVALGDVPERVLTTGDRVLVWGLFERRKAGREPGYGDGGAYRGLLHAGSQGVTLLPGPPAAAAAGRAVTPPVARRQAPRATAPAETLPVLALRRDGAVLLPLRALCGWLGLTLDLAGDGQWLFVLAGSRQVGAVRAGRRLCYVRPDPAQPRVALVLPTVPVVVDGRTYVPAEFLEAVTYCAVSEAAGWATIEWGGAARRLMVKG